MRQKISLLSQLFFTFLKIGLFTFGGGYAMISVIENTCVERKKWITHEDMMHMTVISESTPGPIAINCATFVGLQKAGLVGAAVATFGVALPSFAIILLIAAHLDNFLAYPLVARAFRGIQVGVSLLILRVGLTMVRKEKKDPLSRGILLGAFGAALVINIFSLNISTIVLMLLAGTLGLIVHIVKKGGDGA